MCAADVGVAGGVIAQLCMSLFCMSILAGRRRVGDSGGVDNDCELNGPGGFLDVSVNDSSVQRLRSSWSCSVFSLANVVLVEFDPSSGPSGGTVRL